MTTALAEAPASPKATSLVTPPQAQRTQKPLLQCTQSIVFRETCFHGNWRYIRVPCKRWRCPACGRARLHRELVPEIGFALKDAYSRGWTLKLLTFTWQGQDIGALDTPAGQNRRRLDLAHFKQSLTRNGSYLAYMRVSELHRRGTVHVHALAVMPYLPQTLYSLIWRRHARLSRIVDIRPLGLKCPRCWDPKLKDETLRRQRIIVLNPGKETAQCHMCGLSVNAATAIEGTSVAGAWEIGKYLLKNPVNKLSRTRNWQPYHKQALLLNKRNASTAFCPDCQDSHIYRPLTFDDLHDLALIDSLAVETGLPQRFSWNPPCNCWAWPDYPKPLPPKTEPLSLQHPLLT